MTKINNVLLLACDGAGGFRGSSRAILTGYVEKMRGNLDSAITQRILNEKIPTLPPMVFDYGIRGSWFGRREFNQAEIEAKLREFNSPDSVVLALGYSTGAMNLIHSINRIGQNWLYQSAWVVLIDPNHVGFPNPIPNRNHESIGIPMLPNMHIIGYRQSGRLGGMDVEYNSRSIMNTIVGTNHANIPNHSNVRGAIYDYVIELQRALRLEPNGVRL